MRKTAFLFSGGGAQYPGMMKELYDNILACKKIFDKADEIVGRKLSDICFFGPEKQLNDTSTMIPAIFTADIAVFAAMNEYNIHPMTATGFSLGEWAALVAAGVLPFEKAIELVQMRSDVMAESTPAQGGGMSVIIGDPNEYVEELCNRIPSKEVYVANYNCPGQVTISGTNKGLKEIEKLAEEDEAIYKRLLVDVPSHCVLMKPAMEAMTKALEDVSFTKPSFPIFSNATAEATDDPKKIKENVIIQLVNPVRFEQSIHNMMADGIDTFVELGPGQTLYKFVKKITKKAKTKATVANVEDMETLNAVSEMYQ